MNTRTSDERTANAGGAKREALLAPSILSADFTALGEAVRAAARSGARYVHFDVMDGHFVPNISFGSVVLKSLLAFRDLPFDVHLMIEDADRHIPDFVTPNTAFITVHQEACPHLHRTIRLIRSLGARPGVALNPATPVSTLENILTEVDLVLVMSVNPGFGGQTLIPATLDKARELARMRAAAGLDFMIETDGGVNLENARAVADAGTDIFVAGSAFFRAPDPEEWARAFFARVL